VEGAYSAPQDLLAGLKGPTCKRREGKRTASKDKEGEECGRGEEKGRGQKREGKGVEGRERKCSRPYRLHF